MEKAADISQRKGSSGGEDIEKEAASLSESFEQITSNQDHPLSQTNSHKSVVEDTLSRLASHLTTRSIRDPGPPPDGGFTVRKLAVQTSVLSMPKLTPVSSCQLVGNLTGSR
jgi:hypothetical protein